MKRWGRRVKARCSKLYELRTDWAANIWLFGLLRPLHHPMWMLLGSIAKVAASYAPLCRGFPTRYCKWTPDEAGRSPRPDQNRAQNWTYAPWNFAAGAANSVILAGCRAFSLHTVWRKQRWTDDFEDADGLQPYQCLEQLAAYAIGVSQPFPSNTGTVAERLIVESGGAVENFPAIPSPT